MQSNGSTNHNYISSISQCNTYSTCHMFGLCACCMCYKLCSKVLALGRNTINSTQVAPIHINKAQEVCRIVGLLGNRRLTRHIAPDKLSITPELITRHLLSSNAGNVMWRICHLYTYNL